MNLLYQQVTENQIYLLFVYTYILYQPTQKRIHDSILPRLCNILVGFFFIETDRKHYKGYKILIQYTFAYIVNRIQYIYIYKCISVYKSVYLDGNENR